MMRRFRRVLFLMTVSTVGDENRFEIAKNPGGQGVDDQAVFQAFGAMIALGQRL